MEINKGERTEIKVTNETTKCYQRWKEDYGDFDRQKTGVPGGSNDAMAIHNDMCFAAFDQGNDLECLLYH